MSFALRHITSFGLNATCENSLPLSVNPRCMYRKIWYRDDVHPQFRPQLPMFKMMKAHPLVIEAASCDAVGRDSV